MLVLVHGNSSLFAAKSAKFFDFHEVSRNCIKWYYTAHICGGGCGGCTLEPFSVYCWLFENVIIFAWALPNISNSMKNMKVCLMERKKHIYTYIYIDVSVCIFTGFVDLYIFVYVILCRLHKLRLQFIEYIRYVYLIEAI